MRDAASKTIVGYAMALMVCAAVSVSAQDVSPEPAEPHRPEQFAGTWDYNADESIDITTGRPEQNPRGPVARRPVARGRASGASSERGTLFPPSPESMRESRELARDLLEVPETLTLRVSADSVTIIDDLDRELAFPIDGSRQRYRISAAEFFARVRWEGDRLRKDIEGTFDFRMSEVYFLSPDANRLFVIVRVGEPGRGRPLIGFDRVYDRVEPATP